MPRRPLPESIYLPSSRNEWDINSKALSHLENILPHIHPQEFKKDSLAFSVIPWLSL